MPRRRTAADTGNRMINVFDGTRALIDSKVKLLVRIFDGNQQKQFTGYKRGPSIPFKKTISIQ